MNRKCALLFLLFCTSACLKNDVVPLEFENSGKEKLFLESDNVIVLPESEENLIEEPHKVGSSEENFGPSEERFPTWMNGMKHKIVKRYHCSVDGHGFMQNDAVTLLIHGTKTWSFPRQDVNLTLFYPMDNMNEGRSNYLITAFEVMLFIDGSKSTGYINYGGLMKDCINLSFVMSNITILGYQFQLYGVRNTGLLTELPMQIIELCT